MKCLHGKPAASSTTKNGSFWFCDQKPSCNFFCPEDDGYQFEKAIATWRSLGTPQPKCDGHHKLARMRIVKDLMKASYGRPYFVCAEKSNPCSFWIWGDVINAIKPNCRHGFPSCIRKVKKDGLNKDRKFFCCANGKEDSCGFFEWVPSDEMEPYSSVNFSTTPQYSYDTVDGTKYMNDLTNYFQNMTIT